MWRLVLTVIFIGLTTASLAAGELDSLTANDANDPWAPHTNFPKFTTPQWVGEPGVEAVVVLAIDDMRDPAVYETYLRPILERLKQIDGRASASIMTCRVTPDQPQLQAWLKEGLSLEVHTFDHPCPCLQQGQLAKAKETVDKCIDLLNSVPNNRAVCFRMPCCDSINSVSPRFFTEIFDKTTSAGNFLELDSSVFTCFTPADPSLPRELLFEADGTERFRKYIPKELPAGGVVRRNFVNIIENYPYPYVIGRGCWELPCMAPSDWSAQFLHKPNNPVTVQDWKIALDLTVQKQGVFNLVFHPHNWIKPQQVVEFIDHAITRHGGKVKFLSFREVRDRLVKHATAGQPLRDDKGNDNGVRLLDINGDGFQDVVIANKTLRQTRVWQPKENRWLVVDFPFALARDKVEPEPKFGRVKKDIPTTVFEPAAGKFVAWHWDQNKWQRSEEVLDLGHQFRLRDIDGDGLSDFLTSEAGSFRVLFATPEGKPLAKPIWPVEVPHPLHAGLRIVDLDEDGSLDLVYSDHEKFSLHLWKSREAGWELLKSGRHDKVPAEEAIPAIVRADGSDNGFFVRQRTLCWQNEDSAAHPDLIWRRTFADLLKGRWPGPRSPQSSLQSMRPRPGVRVELFAAEPDVMDPVAIDWGADGKVWVVEMADYPLGVDGKGKNGGRVRCLIDSDGDGRCDRSTLFAEELRFPTGVIAWKNGVLVSAAPEIIYLADSNGDGQADVREVLYRGFTEGNQQHRVNGFARGLDGWLYLANGDSGGTITSVKTGESVDLRGRDLRIEPANGKLEACSGQAQFGRNRDDWGNWFGCNNSRPLWHYVLEDRYLKRNPYFAAPAVTQEVPLVPGNAPVFPSSHTLLRFNDFHTANRFTSACASNFIRDDLWGSDFLGSSLVCEPVHNLVHREILQPQGASFRSERPLDEQHSEFLSSTDAWFRPTMAKTGPDGAIWIADMYRLVIEHPQWIPQEWQQKLDLRAGSDRGRIWRVVPESAMLRKIPRWDQLSTEALVALLDSGNGTVRDLSQERLVANADSAAVILLKKLVRDSQRPNARLQALWTLQLLQGLDWETLQLGLKDADPNVRRNAIVLCEGRQDTELGVALAKLADDASPQVRLQLALSLGSISAESSPRLLVQLISKSDADPWFRAAVLSSLNPDNLPAVVTGVLATAPNGSPWVTDLLAQAAAMKSSRSAAALLAVISRAAENPTAISPWLALEQFQTAAHRGSGEWLKGLPADARQHWQSLVVTARERAQGSSFPAEVRAAATRVLGWDSKDHATDAALAQTLLSPRESPELQAAALQVLARSAGDQFAELLIDRWRSLGIIRADAGQLLLQRPAAIKRFLQAIESDTIDRALVDLALRQRLLNHPDSGLKETATRLLSIGSSTERLAAINAAVTATRSGGNATAGGELFRSKCATCHKLGEVGFAVGPDLVSLTDKSPEALLTAILDPNRAVEAKYLNFVASTTSGQSYQGLLAAESSTSVTLRGPEAKETPLLRNELEQLSATNKSLMPEGFQTDLSTAQLVDLIAFVRANVPLPKRKAFPNNQPEIVKADEAGQLKLLPRQAEIYGSTLILEEKYGNLGWWSSLDDEAHWRVAVPRAGKYRVQWDYACEPAAAGNRCKITGGHQPLVVKVKPTANWDTYQSEEIGVLELKVGEQRLIFRADNRPLPALLDLRGVTLTPIRD